VRVEYQPAVQKTISLRKSERECLSNIRPYSLTGKALHLSECQVGPPDTFPNNK
jgi:hypothetical protein